MRAVFKEVYTLDKKCYEEFHLTEDILMENAAANLEAAIPEDAKVVNIVAGPGNNGADGITLARRILGEKEVNLYLPYGAKSEMAKLQLKRFLAVGGKVEENYKNCDVLVDCVFGSGLKRDVDAKLISKMNKVEAFKIACDIPTGIDDNGNLRPIAFKADVTVTMGAEKLALYSDAAKDYVGRVKVANLGVDFSKYINKSEYFVWEKEDLILPIRKTQNTHKRSYGHLGVLVGDKEGAGIIASLAALNFGAGLVSIVQSEKCKVKSVPYEIMVSEKIEGFSALAFGMGMGDCFDVKELLKLDIPMVIDADMFYKEEIKEFLNKKVVLTPHPKEFSSLLKIIGLGEFSTQEVQENRFKLAEMFSEKYPNVVLLLKGANKIIAYNKQLHIDPNGDVALAKGGSGDVLAGMIGSLLAQGWHPFKATIHASLAHSIAGNYTPNYNLTPLKIIERLREL